MVHLSRFINYYVRLTRGCTARPLIDFQLVLTAHQVFKKLSSWCKHWREASGISVKLKLVTGKYQDTRHSNIPGCSVDIQDFQLCRLLGCYHNCRKLWPCRSGSWCLVRGMLGRNSCSSRGWLSSERSKTEGKRIAKRYVPSCKHHQAAFPGRSWQAPYSVG